MASLMDTYIVTYTQRYVNAHIAQMFASSLVTLMVDFFTLMCYSNKQRKRGEINMKQQSSPPTNNYAGLMYNSTPYDFCDKAASVRMYCNYMFDRTRHIFKYENLPETLNERMLEFYLQTNGNACIAEVNGNLYAFIGGMGGEPDPYYMPTLYTIANPALKYSAQLKIDEECVVIPNDSTYTGLLNMFRYYATLDVETDISFKRMLVNMRKLNVFSANNDRTAQSAREYLDKIENGSDGIITEIGLTEALKVQPVNEPNNIITDLIEFKQYNKASWLNFVGINSNYNMKRETLNSNETQLNEDMLYPLIDDMFEQRLKGVDKINAMFGTNITVSLDSTWKDKDVLKEAEIEAAINEAEETSTEDAEDVVEEPSETETEKPESERESEPDSEPEAEETESEDEPEQEDEPDKEVDDDE